MKFTAEQIAGILEGEVVGNPNAEVFKLSKIEEGTDGSITFLSNPKYAHYIYSTQATITIVNHSFVPESTIATTLIKVEDAYLSFYRLLTFYDQAKKDSKTGIEQFNVISDNVSYGENLFLGSFSYIVTNVTLGNNVKIYPNCYVGDNVTIGNNVTLFAGAKIYSETTIGNFCVIHSCVVIGADGFPNGVSISISFTFSIPLISLIPLPPITAIFTGSILFGILPPNLVLYLNFSVYL